MLLRDVRFGLRMLLKQPGFSAIAVFTLALGIGATAAVFSLIQGVLLTPPPYWQPERLALVPSVRADGQKTADVRGWPAQQWLDWQQNAKSIDGVAAYSWSFNYLVRDQGSESIEGMYCTRDYFKVTGMRPVLGRTFDEVETKPGQAPVIVIGHEFWQREFNGDRNVIGRTVRISRWKEQPVIIGVMPPGARFLPSPGDAREPNYNVNATVDFWVPANPDPKDAKSPRWDVVVRLRDGSTLPQAQSELSMLVSREAQAERDFQGFAPHLEALGDEMNRDGRRILLPLLGAAALVLLIACGNVAALLLVRGLQRQQEYAVRSALGMGRGALLRQVAAESLLLAISGGVLGIALAVAVVRLFKLIGGHAIPRLDSVSTGWPVLAWGFGTAVAAALLAGLFPAMRAFGLDPIEVLKSAGPKSSAGRGERRLLRAVTLVQTALTLALLVGAGILIRTMVNIARVHSGFNTSKVLTMSVTAVRGDWLQFHRRALERVSALPGVEYAAFAWGVPLTGNNWPGTVDIEGQPEPAKQSDRIAMPIRSVTSNYFKLLGLPIVDGRELRDTDNREAPRVAIVNEAFAQRYFPHQSPVGKKLWPDGRQQKYIEIVGEVSDGRTDDLTQSPSPEVYLSLWQASAFSKHLVVRTTADPRNLIALVQRELYAVDNTAAVEMPKTMEQIRNDSLASRIFAMQLLVGFSVVGSVLTLVGIYGVLSLSVVSRRRELAIRSAVGAGKQDIRNLVFAEGFRLIAGGVVAGIAAAIVLSRVLTSFLYEVQPGDPLTLAGVGLLFVVVALLACWVPVHRAAKVDPLEALRYE